MSADAARAGNAFSCRSLRAANLCDSCNYAQYNDGDDVVVSRDGCEQCEQTRREQRTGNQTLGAHELRELAADEMGEDVAVIKRAQNDAYANECR